MAVPTFTQIEAYDAVAVSTTPATVPGATGSFTSAISANATLVVVINQNTANVRTYTVEDDTTGSYTAMTTGPQGTNSNRKAWIYYRTAVGAGTVNIRITSSGSETLNVRCYELSECSYDNASSRVGVSTDVDATFGYPCSADAASIDTQADCALIAAITLTAAGAGLAAGSGWSNGAGSTTSYYSQSKTSAGALTNDQAYIAESGTDRNYASAVISFYVPSAGGGAGPLIKGSLLTGLINGGRLVA